MPTANDKRIARNAVYLYGRMMLTVFVSLYTSRVVLDVLGVADYGVYNVVGGIVLILGFLNGTMSGATQRFISYELGAGNPDKLRRTFSAALTVHAGIALLMLVVAETFGLWYVNHELVIAPERIVAANWVYQFSVLAAVVTVFQIPYVAAIMAHERMGYYALVAITNVLLKLAVILIVLFIAAADSLPVYAALIFVAAAIVGAMYIIYSRRQFAECRWMRRNDGRIVRNLLKFCSWDIYGNLCFTSRAQGMLVILNRFGGTVLNAAGGLCATVSATINSFAGSVVTAFRPQIIQQYAKGDYAYMVKLMCNCARFSLLLLGLLIVPLIIGMDSLLGMWLVEVPAYTADFCRLALVAVCGEMLHSIVGAGVHATGKVVRISFISGTMFILELPLMWWLLTVTRSPGVIYIVHLVAVFAIGLVDTLILKVQMRQFAVRRFWLRGVLTPMLIIAATFAATWLFSGQWHYNIWRLIAMALISSSITGILTWIFILDTQMRTSIKNRLWQHVRRS